MERYMRKFILGLAIALAACNIASAKEYITLDPQLVILSSMKMEVGYWAHMINLHVDYMKASNTFVYGSFYENGQKTIC